MKLEGEVGHIRQVVDRVDGDGHRRRVNGARRIAHRVDEAVRTMEVRFRRVGEPAVGAHLQGAAQRPGDQGDRQCGPGVVGVRVVGQQIGRCQREGRILVDPVAVVGRSRGRVGHVDQHIGGSRHGGAVGHPVCEHVVADEAGVGRIGEGPVRTDDRRPVPGGQRLLGRAGVRHEDRAAGGIEPVDVVGQQPRRCRDLEYAIVASGVVVIDGQDRRGAYRDDHRRGGASLRAVTGHVRERDGVGGVRRHGPAEGAVILEREAGQALRNRRDQRGAVDEGGVIGQDTGIGADRQRLAAVRRVEIVAGNRRQRVHVDAHRGRVAPRGAVGGAVGEAVGAQEACRRRVGVDTVGARVQDDASFGRDPAGAGPCHRLVVGVEIIGQQVVGGEGEHPARPDREVVGPGDGRGVEHVDGHGHGRPIACHVVLGDLDVGQRPAVEGHLVDHATEEVAVATDRAVVEMAVLEPAADGRVPVAEQLADATGRVDDAAIEIAAQRARGLIEHQRRMVQRPGAHRRADRRERPRRGRVVVGKVPAGEVDGAGVQVDVQPALHRARLEQHLARLDVVGQEPQLDRALRVGAAAVDGAVIGQADGPGHAVERRGAVGVVGDQAGRARCSPALPGPVQRPSVGARVPRAGARRLAQAPPGEGPVAADDVDAGGRVGCDVHAVLVLDADGDPVLRGAVDVGVRRGARARRPRLDDAVAPVDAQVADRVAARLDHVERDRECGATLDGDRRGHDRKRGHVRHRHDQPADAARVAGGHLFVCQGGVVEGHLVQHAAEGVPAAVTRAVAQPRVVEHAAQRRRAMGAQQIDAAGRLEWFAVQVELQDTAGRVEHECRVVRPPRGHVGAAGPHRSPGRRAVPVVDRVPCAGPQPAAVDQQVHPAAQAARFVQHLGAPGAVGPEPQFDRARGVGARVIDCGMVGQQHGAAGPVEPRRRAPRAVGQGRLAERHAAAVGPVERRAADGTVAGRVARRLVQTPPGDGHVGQDQAAVGRRGERTVGPVLVGDRHVDRVQPRAVGVDVRGHLGGAGPRLDGAIAPVDPQLVDRVEPGVRRPQPQVVTRPLVHAGLTVHVHAGRDVAHVHAAVVEALHGHAAVDRAGDEHATVGRDRDGGLLPLTGVEHIVADEDATVEARFRHARVGQADEHQGRLVLDRGHGEDAAVRADRDAACVYVAGALDRPRARDRRHGRRHMAVEADPAQRRTGAVAHDQAVERADGVDRAQPQAAVGQRLGEVVAHLHHAVDAQRRDRPVQRHVQAVVDTGVQRLRQRRVSDPRALVVVADLPLIETQERARRLEVVGAVVVEDEHRVVMAPRHLLSAEGDLGEHPCGQWRVGKDRQRMGAGRGDAHVAATAGVDGRAPECGVGGQVGQESADHQVLAGRSVDGAADQDSILAVHRHRARSEGAGQPRRRRCVPPVEARVVGTQLPRRVERHHAAVFKGIDGHRMAPAIDHEGGLAAVSEGCIGSTVGLEACDQQRVGAGPVIRMNPRGNDPAVRVERHVVEPAGHAVKRCDAVAVERTVQPAVRVVSDHGWMMVVVRSDLHDAPVRLQGHAGGPGVQPERLLRVAADAEPAVQAAVGMMSCHGEGIRAPVTGHEQAAAVVDRDGGVVTVPHVDVGHQAVAAEGNLGPEGHARRPGAPVVGRRPCAYGVRRRAVGIAVRRRHVGVGHGLDGAIAPVDRPLHGGAGMARRRAQFQRVRAALVGERQASRREVGVVALGHQRVVEGLDGAGVEVDKTVRGDRSAERSHRPARVGAGRRCSLDRVDGARIGVVEPIGAGRDGQQQPRLQRLQSLPGRCAPRT